MSSDLIKRFFYITSVMQITFQHFIIVVKNVVQLLYEFYRF